MDILLAFAVWLLDLALFSTVGSNLAEIDSGGVSALWLAGYAALGSLALVWRRRWTVWVYAFVWLHALVGTALVHGYAPVLALLVALYTLGAHRPRRLAWLIAPAVLPFAISAANEAARSKPDDQIITFIGLTTFYALLSGGVWALGYWTGVSRRRLAEAERLRAAAVATERARISRELHDIVAHTVTVMVLQAAGAQRIIGSDPARASEALTQVELLGRQAMSELRRMLALHGDDKPVQQPGLTDLQDLLEGMRRTGIPVEMVVIGQPRQVDPSVELAVYRAVQEALTNVAKHAGSGAAATVRLDWTDELTVEVANTSGRAPLSKALSTGNGLLGLRERIAIVGGAINARRVDEGGFAVTVSLPT